MEQQEFSFTAGGSANPAVIMEGSSVVSYKLNIVLIVQSLSRVWLFVTSWTVACKAPLSSTISQSLLKFMSTESVMPPTHLTLHFSPAAYWTPDLRGSSSGVPLFCLFILFMGLWARILQGVAISSSRGPRLVRTLHYDPPVLGGPAWHGS